MRGPGHARARAEGGALDSLALKARADHTGATVAAAADAVAGHTLPRDAIVIGAPSLDTGPGRADAFNAKAHAADTSDGVPVQSLDMQP